MLKTHFIQSSTWLPRVGVSSAVARMTGTQVLMSSTADLLMMPARMPVTVASTQSVVSSRALANRGRRMLWLGASPHLAQPIAAHGTAMAVRADPTSAPAKGKPAELAAEPAKGAEAGPPAREGSAAPPLADPEVSEAAAAEISSAERTGGSRRSEDVRLEIESLKYYEVIKPIPVVVRALGERTFEAEVPDLNLSTTGSSIMGAFLATKEQIVSIFDRYRGKRVLDGEQQRQLAQFKEFIGDARRDWHAG